MDRAIVGGQRDAEETRRQARDFPPTRARALRSRGAENTMGDSRLTKGLFPLRLKDGRDEEKRLGDDLVQEEEDRLPGLAEAHLVGEDASAYIHSGGGFSFPHPHEGRCLVRVRDEGSERDNCRVKAATGVKRRI